MLRLGFTGPLFACVALVVACSSSSSSSSGAPAPAQTEAGTDPAPAPAAKDAGTTKIPKGTTCNASKACASGATCVTGGGDEGFCALACDPKIGCANNLRCADVAGRGTFCLESCGDDKDCADGFVCTKSVGAVLGKYACVRSCEGVTDYCGEGATCGDDGLCPPKLVCDLDSSGVAGDRTLGTLSVAERGKVCDFTACGWGGYGKEQKCDNGFSVSAPDSKSECTSRAQWTQCSSVTVAEYEACEKKMRADECKALEILTTDPDCASLKACAM